MFSVFVLVHISNSISGLISMRHIFSLRLTVIDTEGVQTHVLLCGYNLPREMILLNGGHQNYKHGLQIHDFQTNAI